MFARGLAAFNYLLAVMKEDGEHPVGIDDRGLRQWRTNKE